MSHISLYFSHLYAVSVVWFIWLFFLITCCPYFWLVFGKPMALPTAEGRFTENPSHSYPSASNISKMPPIVCLIDGYTTSGAKLATPIPQSSLFIWSSWLSPFRYLSTFLEDVLTGTLSADISKAGRLTSCERCDSQPQQDSSTGNWNKPLKSICYPTYNEVFVTSF